MSLRWRVSVLVIVSASVIGAFWWSAGPIPQPLWYHDFSDQRPMLGLPHALNVLSNLPFVLVGLLGSALLVSRRSRRAGMFVDEVERRPYWAFMIGLVLTGVGSSYYHANPTNATLVWDRAALAITLMALFAAVLAERVHKACAGW